MKFPLYEYFLLSIAKNRCDVNEMIKGQFLRNR